MEVVRNNNNNNNRLRRMTSKQPEKTNTRTIAALGNFSAMNIIIVIINLHDTCNDRHRKNVYDA